MTTKTPGRKGGNAKQKIEHYTHADKKRANNPPVGLVTPETDPDAGKKTYTFDPHLDPALQWAGKAERTSFEITTVSLHVHERIDPRSIIEAVRRKNGENFVQGSLFSRLDENPPIRFHASLGIPAADHTALWKLPQLWKSNKEAFGNFFLMISTAAWIIPSSE